jgi:hypothetical protein
MQRLQLLLQLADPGQQRPEDYWHWQSERRVQFFQVHLGLDV